MDDQFDFGALLQPVQQAGDDISSKMKDPIVRSAMLSAGLQMMTGGWGNGTQQLAAGIGAGAQGAAATAGALQEQGLKDQARQDKMTEGAANRASHEKVASIGADSRQEVAHIRGIYSNERARIALAKAPPDIASKMIDQARKIVEGGIGNLSLPDAAKTQLIMDKAAELYQLHGELGATTRDEKANAGVGSGLSSPAKLGAAVPAKAGSGPTLEQLLADPTAGPRAQQDLQTPEGRGRLAMRFPSMKAEIEKRGNIPFFPTLNQLRGFFPSGGGTPEGGVGGGVP